MNHPINIDSVLEIKASGSLNIEQDLTQLEGKSIAELLYDQENKTSNQQ